MERGQNFKQKYVLYYLDLINCFRLLINTYGWRGALLFSSGIILQGCISGLMIHSGNRSYPSRNRRKGRNGRQTERQAGHTETSSTESKKMEYKASDELIISPLPSTQDAYKSTMHRSLMDVRIQTSDQCLASRRTVSCHLDTSYRSVDNLRTHYLPQGLYTSWGELYLSAVASNRERQERGEQPPADTYTITKEIFSDINFLLLAGNILLFCFGFSVLYTHAAAYGASVGLSVFQINNMFSALGISNMFGRLSLGFIGKEFFF